MQSTNCASCYAYTTHRPKCSGACVPINSEPFILFGTDPSDFISAFPAVALFIYRVRILYTWIRSFGLLFNKWSNNRKHSSMGFGGERRYGEKGLPAVDVGKWLRRGSIAILFTRWALLLLLLCNISAVCCSCFTSLPSFLLSHKESLKLHKNKKNKKTFCQRDIPVGSVRWRNRDSKWIVIV